MPSHNDMAPKRSKANVALPQRAAQVGRPYVRSGAMFERQTLGAETRSARHDERTGPISGDDEWSGLSGQRFA